MREVVVEDYLRDRVKETGGFIRKCIWGGRKSAPDDFCWWPNGKHAWVETKKPGETPRPDQLREHVKMRKGGCDVWVIDTKAGVDIFIDVLTSGVVYAKSE
jgi:hypothetical protein